MSKELEFKVGDVIGIYTVTDCAGEDASGEIHWNIITPKGNEATFSSTQLRKELRKSKLTSEYVLSLSANALKTLVNEVGEATIEKALKRQKPSPKVSSDQIQAAWDRFFQEYPQANFQANVTAILAELKTLPNPTYKYSEIQKVYEDLMPRGLLKLNLAALGLDKKYGMKIVANYSDLMKLRLSSADYARLAFPTAQRTPHEADSLTAEQVREIDKKQNPSGESHWEIESREKALGLFFDIHRNLAASSESEKVKTALIDYVKANQLPIANVQSYENALNALIANRTIEQAVPKVSATDPIQRYGGTTLTVNPPRKRNAPTSSLLTDVAIVERKKNFTEAQIHAMSHAEYAQYLRSPEFREAVDAMKQ